MPKNEIDYSNTIIYKIYCKDDSISGVYVGHTTNFIKRKYQHKVACNNLNNNLNIYKIMRENGGWENWEMTEIACYNCKNSEEARIKEQQYYELLNASLNSLPPYTNKLKKYCEICKIQYSSNEKYDMHMKTVNHEELMEIKLSQNSLKKFNCKICYYYTSSKKDFDKHIMTPKHQKRQNGKDLEMLEMKNISKYNCECSKNFSTYSGLWKHKQKCTNKTIEKEDEKEIKVLTSLVLEVIKQNKELINQNNESQKQNQELTNTIVEMSKNGLCNTTITNNSNNKTFNLQFFLNETCKDAMNIMDFVDSINLQLCDLESVGKLGYVEGISNIIVQNLNAMDIHKRPVHCADKKREVLYIKDENKWEKENDDKKKLRQAIRRVAAKNQHLIPKFKEAHPDCGKYHSKFSDQYNKIIVESMGGSGDNDLEKEDKIIKNISKNVVINKD